MLFASFFGRLLVGLIPFRPPSEPSPISLASDRFTLRHAHAQHPSDARGLVMADVAPASSGSFLAQDADAQIFLRSRKTRVWRARERRAWETERARSRRRSRGIMEDEGSAAGGIDWDDTDVYGPDIEDRETLLTLAKMTSNAYLLPSEAGWFPLGDWNQTTPIGWGPEEIGLRGHVFVNDDESTVVVSLKGTNVWLVSGGGPTTKLDRLNDNLLFCCCARVDWTWTTVCDCYGGGNTCGQTCVEDALIEDSLYYPVATNLYNNITVLYPNAEIWLTGHSLGGSVASLLGLTFGAPAVAFESPAERLAAARLHLPMPPGNAGETITHVYNNADPVPMGTCSGVRSTCWAGGFAFETHCHLGKTILYDTVGKLGWSSDIRSHRITTMISSVLDQDWNDGARGASPKEGDDPDRRRAVPRAEPEDDCVDCYAWEFI